MSRKRSNKAEKVIAATAGRDNWQTWAGRKHGSESFEYLDIFRGIKRSISHNLQSHLPKQGTPCPICFCEPDVNESPSSFWHVTWCGHAICKDCLGQFAKTQVEDPEHTGPLTCPVCLKILRKQDAVVAMMSGKNAASNEDDLIKQWDNKMRDQLLRAIPSFRTCPKCGGGDGGEDSKIGGGFVTPECLGPQHQERRDQAIQILLMRNKAYGSVALGYLLFVWIIANTKSPSPYLDLWSMLLPIYVFVKVGMAVNFLLATRAREALFRSIEVGCPCCEESFVLPAQSKQFEDEETSRWMQTNTRPCPSCSVPISKAGGCNHVRCSNCRANFCWACMRLRTNCAAYRCQNGAPYRNASLLDADAQQQVPRLQTLQSDGSVITYVDHILTNRICPELKYGDAILVLTCLVGRHVRIVQFLVEKTVTPFLTFLFERADIILYLLSMVQFVFLFLAMPTEVWNATFGRIFPQHFEPPGRGGRRLGMNRQQLERISRNLAVVFFVSQFSLPVGISIGVGYLVNEAIVNLIQQRPPAIRQEEEENDDEYVLETQQVRLRQPDPPVPQNRNPNVIDLMNEQMLNEALRRSIEET